MINYNLKNIKAIIFDIDGVLSKGTITMDAAGHPMRTMNIKDGYAIQLAQKLGLRIAILTGGSSEAIQVRYSSLGVEDIYQGCAVKINTYEEFLRRYGLTDDEVIYMGDDIPDYEVLKRVGCPTCPKDACSDIKDICLYVSPYDGGCGCGRDIIEQVLRAKGLWLSSAKAFGW